MKQLRTADRGDNPCEQRDQAGHRNPEGSVRFFVCRAR
jgi:hypothetical protein